MVPVVVVIWITAVGLHYDALPTISATWTKPWPAATSADGNVAADSGAVEWSRFAYTQYVTDSHYLCNSVMLFERLEHLGSRADRVMMYPSHMLDQRAADGQTGNDARLLIKARDDYNVRLVPVKVQRRDGSDGAFPLWLRAAAL